MSAATRVPVRRNLVNTLTEGFAPPLFRPNINRRNRIENRLRRFLDLQTGSCWRDLRAELARVSGTLLDIGCGAGLHRELVPEGVTYHGLDAADARAHFGYDIPDTRYFEGDDWGVADATFDTVLCSEVLEHVPDPAAFLARAWRCLRPGGRLLLTVPFAARWHFIPHDYWRYTPSGLNKLLQEAGFAGIHIHARGNPVTVACYKAMTLNLALLFGSGGKPPALAKRLVGICLLPALGLLACVANLSFRMDWGDDCLGYTVTAIRPE